MPTLPSRGCFLVRLGLPYYDYSNALTDSLALGFVLFNVAREYIYYVNLRQAYLSSPYYSQRLSSRTVLFTSIPHRYLDEARLRKLYGDGVRHVWIPRTSKGLVNLVKEREQTAMRLEKAEIALILKANLARNRQLRAEEKAAEKAKKKGAGTGLRRRLQRKRGSMQDHDALDKAENGEAQSASSVGQGPLSRGSSMTSSHDGNGPLTTNYTEGETTVTMPTSRRTSDGRIQAVDATEMAVNIDDDRKSIPAQVIGLDETTKEEAEEAEGGNPTATTTEHPSGDEEEARYVHPYGLDPGLPDVRGSVAAQYIPVEHRPHHRPLGNFGRRVDTIRWTRNRLEELNKRISKLRRQVLRGAAKGTETIPAAFVEFDTQEAAQAAHQVLAHHQPLHMAPRLLGIRPEEVVWSSLRQGWLERIIRRFAILGLIVAAIIFWSIPSVIVGAVSNVQTMTQVVFLKWLKQLPSPILGFLTGFVPAFVLSLFMAIVPHLLRCKSNSPSFCAYELG